MPDYSRPMPDGSRRELLDEGKVVLDGLARFLPQVARLVGVSGLYIGKRSHGRHVGWHPPIGELLRVPGLKMLPIEGREPH